MKSKLVKILSGFISAMLVVAGIGLGYYYLKAGLTFGSIAAGVCAIAILYPSFKIWQEKFEKFFTN